MNIKDFTFKIGYIKDGVEKFECLEAAELSKGFDNGDISLKEMGDEGVKIVLSSSAKLRLTLAEMIYDRYFEMDDLFFANGFQSWTTTREYGRMDVQRGLNPICRLPYVRYFAGASGDYSFTQYGKQLYHSFTYTYIRSGERLQFFGSLNERTGYTVFYADMKEHVLAVVKDVDGVDVDGEYELFDIVYFEGGYDEVFDRYFRAYPLKHTGRVKHLAGYTSWYNYYQNIDEDIILRDLEGLKRAGDAANIFQIDDGYETKVGDWTLDNKKFPNGMRPIVDKIHAQNLLAGLWIAPYAAEFKADIVKTHPEWLIKNSKGKPIISGAAWGGFYALDFELEEVRAYIKALFDKVFDEWDFDMVKLDFLYAAAIQPRNGKSRGQLMCEAMDFLRECCKDKLILGCGVPLGPAFGIVDACRIGCDAETSFKDKFYVKMTNQEIISTRNAMNNAIFRRHLNGRIMANDPDVFFLRNGGMKPAKYNLMQKMLLAKVNHIFGSVLFVSDDIGEYDDMKFGILLDAYKPFEGKVTKCEYQDADKIRVEYFDGESKTLIFDVLTGKNSEM